MFVRIVPGAHSSEGCSRPLTATAEVVHNSAGESLELALAIALAGEDRNMKPCVGEELCRSS